MLDQAHLVRVVIASPGDLEAERKAIPPLFVRWNHANQGIHLIPEMWETGSVPTYGDHPQHILTDQIVKPGDLLVALFWTKIGSPTPSAPSGTIEEIREFVRRKGPKRVMLYFCNRPLTQSPFEIDYTAIRLIQEFKEEMQSKCLYQDFIETGDFEKHLYYHLDIKTNELLRGLLPLPGQVSQSETEIIFWDPNAPDERLRQPHDFGSSVEEIATQFVARMDEFDGEGGATNNKFLNLGTHVYYSVARSLENALSTQPYNSDVRMRPQLFEIVLSLRRLADDSSSYVRRPFPDFWNEGRAISNKLSSTIKRFSYPRLE